MGVYKRNCSIWTYFSSFYYKNDFHNLKAVLKCSLSRIDPSSYFLSPSVFSPNDIKEAILNKNFDLLPDPLKECGKVAYDILVRTQDGQLVDVVIDSFMLSTIYEEGKKIDNKFIKSLIFDICDLTNLKIALRCAKLNKSAEFLNRALIDSPSFSKEELVENSLLGLSHFLNFVRETKFSGAASAFEFSISNFETWCDNYYFDKLESAKYIFLGPEPICDI